MSRDSAKLPSQKASDAAASALRALAPLQRRKVPNVLLVARDAGREIKVPLPDEAFHLLVQVLELISSGHAGAVLAAEAEVTTQEAAVLLNVSRPYVVALLESGKIPYRLVGSHRRVRVADITAYKTTDDQQRKAVLDELTAEAEKHRLGY